MSWQQIFYYENSFTLLIARPGWGKTSLLIELYRKNKINKIIYLSPLKALATEVGQRLKKIGGHEVTSRGKLEELWGEIKNRERYFLAGTVESFSEGILESVNKAEETLIVFDEWHLFYYWGETFRGHLWEMVMFICSANFPVLAMSATLESELLHKWQKDFVQSRNQLILINLGNQMLKTLPKKHHYFPSLFKKNLRHIFIRKMLKNKSDTLIYFCRYREEVDQWLDFSVRIGVKALGCVGGEVENFCEQLSKNPKPDCIFTTSALSHGVNLPTISSLFISYPLKNKDFWVQTVGRAGRMGEDFELYECDGYFLNSLAMLKQLVYNGAYWCLVHLKRYTFLG